ncbi:penicillin-binding transpeptidase domain-containing protein [Granulicoccus phenolivorans]|uniref:penicillin-binding transpeptidase domain-containing protein n=1 Tax=Granulicoccus phenolivorans TaxID=266854 RepID=UPI00047D2A6D|nr:penicillin-binding transpeptidase domain-containing protein [Granulicoccus phenolivorans]
MCSIGALVVALSSCSGGPAQPANVPIDPPADALVHALNTGDFLGVLVKDGVDVKAEYDAGLAGMRGMRPQVTKVRAWKLSDSVTSVELKYSWPLSAPWTYDTKAQLTLVEGDWQLTWDPKIIHPDLTAGTRLERRREPAKRGGITGNNGVVLVQEWPAMSIGIDKSRLGSADAEESARKLADLVDIDADGYAALVQQAPADSFVEALAVRLQDAPSGIDEIPGAVSRAVDRQLPEKPGFARSVLGTVGPPSADQVAQSGGRIWPEDNVGQSGVQKSFDDKLRGAGSSKVFLTGRDTPVGTGEIPRNLIVDFPARNGEQISITLDERVQTAAETAIADLRGPAAVVVLNPDTGAILAAANNRAAAPGSEALQAHYSAGALYTPVATLGLLRAGVAADTAVDCPKEVSVDGRTVKLPTGVRESTAKQPLTRQAANGCTTALAAQSAKVPQAALNDAARSLGMNEGYDIGLETDFGRTPSGGPEALAGEGEVRVSPLGLAAMAATIQQGRTMVPWVQETKRPGPAGPPLTESEAKALQEILRTGAGSGTGTAYSGLQGALAGRSATTSWVMGYGNGYAIAVLGVADPAASQADPPALTQTVNAVTTAARAAVPSPTRSPR